MTNRLELNWSLDGFVDEQRYYCSEAPIDASALPAPKAVLRGDARSHIDTFVTLSSVYNIAISSVKNNAEKLSKVKRVQAGDGDWSSVISLLYFNSNFNDETTRSWIVNSAALTNQELFHDDKVKFAEFHNAELRSSNNVSLGSGDFTIEMWSKGSGSLFSKRIPTGTTNLGFTFFVRGDGKLAAWNGSQEISTQASININEVTHKAYVKQGDRLKIFNNGLNVYDDVYTLADNSYPMQIGAAMYNGAAADFFNGIIAMPRISKMARYTENFNPIDYIFPNK